MFDSQKHDKVKSPSKMLTLKIVSNELYKNNLETLHNLNGLWLDPINKIKIFDYLQIRTKVHELFLIIFQLIEIMKNNVHRYNTFPYHF